MVFNLVEKTSDAGEARRLRSELPARSFVPLLPFTDESKGNPHREERTNRYKENYNSKCREGWVIRDVILKT